MQLHLTNILNVSAPSKLFKFRVLNVLLLQNLCFLNLFPRRSLNLIRLFALFFYLKPSFIQFLWPCNLLNLSNLTIRPLRDNKLLLSNHLLILFHSFLPVLFRLKYLTFQLTPLLKPLLIDFLLQYPLNYLLGWNLFLFFYVFWIFAVVLDSFIQAKHWLV